MKYFFTAKVEKKDKGYMIQIPFNVWEVCAQREVIKADIVLDNRAFACELLPKEKGNYEIYLEDRDVKQIEPEVPHEILLHVSESLVKIDRESAYSLEKPIRKINSMDIIIQPEDGLCGQTCVAMLAGKTIKDVIQVMDCREWQGTMGRMISALNYYGIGHSEVIHYIEGKDCALPKCCIIMERMGRFCHYLVEYDGKYFDPNLGVMEEYDKSKILGYLEIKCE